MLDVVRAEWKRLHAMVDTAGSVKAGLHAAAEESCRKAEEKEREVAEQLKQKRIEKEKVIWHAMYSTIKA